MEILSVFITAAISVFTAIIILQLQNRIHKKKTFNALRSEIESNLSLAKKILPLVENISREGSKKEHMGTVSDLQRLHTYSYEDFRRAGYLLSLNRKAKELLEEVYD